MLSIATKNGIMVDVPEIDEEDTSKKFTITDNPKDIKSFLHENGYVVVKSAFTSEIVDELNEHWNQEVKKSSRAIYRQATGKLEKNVFSTQGWVMNPILNLQSLDPRYFGGLRACFRKKMCGTSLVSGLFSTILSDKPLVVQSMYFEGNSVTWEHQDSYYLDSDPNGSLYGAWIAMENIDADAGRFFVVPKTQRFDLSRVSKENLIVTNHDKYIDSIVNYISNKNLQPIAPLLEKGDLLIWHSLTIHGSLKSTSLTRSRRSITMHIMPTSLRFMSLRLRSYRCKAFLQNGFNIFAPKDQSKTLSRLTLFLEQRFPRSFEFIRRKVIQLLHKLS